MRRRRENRAAGGLPGFTAVELMIVVLIIALLVSILVPVLSRAYKTAMVMADAALLHQIATGLDMYHQAFSDYPSSTFLNPVTGTYDPWPPPPVPAGGLPNIATNGQANGRVILTGAAKVYAALSGFNATGVPGGAAAIRGCADADPANWTEPCGQLTTRGILVQDPTNNAALAERQPAYGPYYVPNDKQHTKATLSWGGTTAQQDVYASRFARQNAPMPPAGGAAESGSPILYFRARPAPTDLDGNGTIDTWDIFAYEDNMAITDPGRQPISPASDRWKHPLYAPSDGKDWSNADYSAYPAAWAPAPAPRFFGVTRPFTKNGSPQPRLAYNADSFILMSPGPDGQYFTEDDITNFK